MAQICIPSKILREDIFTRRSWTFGDRLLEGSNLRTKLLRAYIRQKFLAAAQTTKVLFPASEGEEIERGNSASPDSRDNLRCRLAPIHLCS